MPDPQHPPRGVLDLTRALQAFHLDASPPSPLLSDWVENYWEVEWNLPPGKSHRQTNLSQVAVHAAVEPEGNWLYGVPGPSFVREIAGTGRVFGIKFLPGAFYPWYRRPLKPLFDRRVPLSTLWGAEGEAWARRVRDESDFRARCTLADGFLLARLPEAAGEGRRCARILINDRTLLRVEDACSKLGHDVRGLQRLFHREVGASPKEVLRRYRLMEAAERLAQDSEISGAALAAALGYADQAHFIRDFKAVIGVPPDVYRKRQSSEAKS